MFLNKLFSNKNTQNTTSNQTEVKKSIGYYTRKVAMILWLGAAVSNSVPAFAQEQEISHFQKQDISELESQKQTSDLSMSTLSSSQGIKLPTLKFAKALPWDSVIWFLSRNFWVQSGWELLIEKDTGNRIINPRTDLIAGREYVLARNEKEATLLTTIYKKRDNKIETVHKEVKPFQSPEKKPQVKYNISNSAFDYSSFLQAISGVESGGKYTADNTKAGEKLKVSNSKHAKGKYQFTNETLAGYGYDNPEKRKKFLQSPELQEELMYKFTQINYEFAQKSPALSQLLHLWIHPTQILATMHHRGNRWAEWIAKYAVKQANPVEAFFNKLESAQWDWLGTKTSKYVQAVSLRYSKIAQVDITNKKSNIPLEQFEESTQIALTQTPEKLPVKEVSTLASNDDVFNTPLMEVNFVSSEKVKEKQPEMIKLIDITPSLPVVETVKEKYKKQLLSKISQDASIPLEVRKSITEKLSKVDDLELYYQEQIDYYNYVLRMSRDDIQKEKAKRILPGLQKLLKDTRNIIASSNDENIYAKKVA